MRKPLAIAALAVGIGAAVLPTSSASAYCDPVLYAATGKCANACTIAASAYRTADDRAKDALPDDPFLCFA